MSKFKLLTWDSNQSQPNLTYPTWLSPWAPNPWGENLRGSVRGVKWIQHFVFWHFVFQHFVFLQFVFWQFVFRQFVFRQFVFQQFVFWQFVFQQFVFRQFVFIHLSFWDTHDLAFICQTEKGSPQVPWPLLKKEKGPHHYSCTSLTWPVSNWMQKKVGKKLAFEKVWRSLLILFDSKNYARIFYTF
jgi:hypothetical protein